MDESLQQCSASSGCCQADIVINNDPDELDHGGAGGDVQVQLQWLGLNRTKDQEPQRGPPARVFIAQHGWSEQSGVHHQLLRTDQGKKITTEHALMEVPVLLEWEVIDVAAPRSSSSNGSTTTTAWPTDISCAAIYRSNHSSCTSGRRGGYTCSCDTDSGYDGNPYIPDGCKDVDECEHPELNSCYGECTNTDGSFEGTCPHGTYGNPREPGGCASHVTAGVECKRLCGGMEVPYPFGIGPPHCYLPGFNLTCVDDDDAPPRLLLRGIRVTNISLANTTVHLLLLHGAVSYSPESEGIPTNTDEYAWVLNVTGGSEPYSLSTLNELILVGCNAQVMLMEDDNSSTIISGCASFCSGNDDVVGRAPAAVNGTGVGGKHSCFGSGCCQARISRDSFPSLVYFKRLDTKALDGDTRLPASVLIAEDGWFDSVGVSTAAAAQEVPLVLRWEVLLQANNVSSSSSSSHNPPASCPAEVAGRICKSEHSHCIPSHRGYSCQCSDSYHGNPYVLHGCTGGPHKTFRGLSIVIGVASGATLVLLVLAAFFISSKLKQHRARQTKQKFFRQNRGQLLQQLVSQRADIAERMIIPLEELEKATSNFDKARELGGGTVYKGILSDLHVVVIKKPKKVNQKEIDEFINEVAILSQINHRNVVKLYGCCLETQVPMLVYEFISNRSLYEHLHVEGPRSLPWDDRLRIAIEIAKSLAYLHSTTFVPIIHRDIKSLNILLDDTLTTKVADFGASRYVSVEKTGLTTMVQGTIGYLDPVYSTTGRLTEKSDVYSYGVILVELMTRTKPFSYISSRGEGLAAHFTTLFKGGDLQRILDPQVMDEGGKEVEDVAAVAVACVQRRGEDRPTMRQVELTLGSLRSSKKHISENVGVKDLQENGVSSTSTMSRRNVDESTRRYSMEEEFMLSARYPR